MVFIILNSSVFQFSSDFQSKRTKNLEHDAPSAKLNGVLSLGTCFSFKIQLTGNKDLLAINIMNNLLDTNNLKYYGLNVQIR